MAAVAAQPPKLQRGASAPVTPVTPVSPDPNPKARRLSGGAQPGRRLSGWRPEDVENLFDENDDEQERQRAAAEAAEAKKKKAVRSPFRETPGHQNRKQIYKEAMASMIRICDENKVSEKNAFALDFIDHMGHVINENDAQDASGGPNFTLASSTLDAASKIYSYKVDAVCTQTYKLARNIDRSGRGGKDAEDLDDLEEAEEAEDPENPDAAEAAKAERSKKAAEKKAAALAAAQAAGNAHIEEKPDALNLKKLDVAFDVDPLFHRTSAKFDEGGAKGLLLSNLNVHRGTQLIFDSSDAMGAGPLPEAPPPPVPRAAIAKLLPTLEVLGAAQVSQPFAEFWRTVRPCGTHSPQDEAAKEEEELEDEEQEEQEEDDAAAPVDVSEGDEEYAPFEPVDVGGGDDDDFDAMERERMLKEAVLDGDGDEGPAAVLDFEERKERRASLGGFLDESDRLAPHVDLEHGIAGAMEQLHLIQGKNRDNAALLGPGHWKFRDQRKARNAESGGADDGANEGKGRGGGGRKAKAAFLIDFSQRAARMSEIANAARDAKTANATVMTAAARAKARETQTTLPHDYHCSIDALETLFDKPAYRVRYLNSKRVKHVVSGEEGAGPSGTAGTDGDEASRSIDAMYPDDDDGYAVETGFGGGEDNDDDDSGGHMPFGAEGGSSPLDALVGGSGPLDLVAAPTKVNKIDIGYARRAKTVDIKALKEDVWTLLQEAPDQGGEDAADDAAPAKKAGRGGASASAASGKEVSFQYVLSKLHEKVPAAKLEEVSFAYCFICLLHLANEKTLELIGEGDMKEMRVRFPK